MAKQNETAIIRSSNGRDVRVSSLDLGIVQRFSWTVDRDGYAKKYLEKNHDGLRIRTVIHMHRLIMNARPGQIVDHINGDKLDNRRSNLRFATRSLNALNSAKTTSLTGFRGVSINHQRGKRYVARITLAGKQVHLGKFDTAEQASEAYLAKQKEFIS